MAEKPHQARIPRVGHIHLKVSDLSRSLAFYQKQLGLEVTEMVEGRYAFLSFGAAHHDLALQEVGDDAPRPEAGAVGLFHVAFEIADQSTFASYYRRLRDNRVPLLTADYGISWAIYLADPDSHGIELYLDRRNADGGRKKWGGTTGRLTPEQILGEEQ